MHQGKRIGAVLLMAGTGSRFGGALPKQFLLLNGIPIYQHTLKFFLNSGYFDEIILVCHPDWLETIPPWPSVRIISGGATRQESSHLGLQGFSHPPDIVSIHDAVRPFLTSDILFANIETAILHGAADTCIPSTDTLVFAPNGQRIESIPLRSHYLRGQTPQTFRYDWIVDAHAKAQKKGIENASDDCRLLLEAGYPVQIVAGSEANIKITTEFDLRRL